MRQRWTKYIHYFDMYWWNIKLRMKYFRAKFLTGGYIVRILLLFLIVRFQIFLKNKEQKENVYIVRWNTSVNLEQSMLVYDQCVKVVLKGRLTRQRSKRTFYMSFLEFTINLVSSDRCCIDIQKDEFHLKQTQMQLL